MEQYDPNNIDHQNPIFPISEWQENNDADGSYSLLNEKWLEDELIYEKREKQVQDLKQDLDGQVQKYINDALKTTRRMTREERKANSQNFWALFDKGITVSASLFGDNPESSSWSTPSGPYLAWVEMLEK